MQFANPWFLIGLSAIAIPLIIHLFNFRRFRKVYFTNVKYIEELKLQTQKQSKLKHLLVLITRILAIASLVLAFARPYVPLNKQIVHPNAQNAVSIYVDNSFSMEARGAKGSLLDEALNKAQDITSAFKPSDLFQLLTADFEGKHQHLVPFDEFSESLGEVKLSPTVRPLSKVISRQLDLLHQNSGYHKNIFIVSDFQKSTTDLAGIKPDTSTSVFLVPLLANQAGNLFIDSCWFTAPVQQLDQQATLKMKIKNTSESDQEKIPLKLMVNNTQKAVASFDCPSRGETELELSFANNEPGIHQAYLEIVDYPVTYDDRFYFTYQVQESMNVLCIWEKAPDLYFDNLFAHDSSVNYSQTQVKSLDYSSLSANSLVILDGLTAFSTGLQQELRNFLDNAGSLVIVPPTEMDPETYRVFMNALGLGSFRTLDKASSRVMKLEAEHSLYRDVFEKIPENLDLPVVSAHYPFLFSNESGAEVLLKLENDDPFLVSFPVSKGKCWVLTSPLDPEFNNLGKHLLFVPTFYQIALLSQPRTRLYYTIGSDDPVELTGVEGKGEEVFKMSKLGENTEFIPENRIIGSRMYFLPHDQVKTSGNYVVKSGTRELMGVSFNYDRKESQMEFFSPDDLKSEISKTGLKNVTVLNPGEKPVSLLIKELNRGVQYWKLFIILALIFVAIEVFLLRFLK